LKNKLEAKIYITLFLIVVLSLFPACNCSGPDDPDPQPPHIVNFSANPEDIMPTDSSVLSWQVQRADKVMLFPDSVELTPAAAGSLVVHPSAQIAYTLVAYNRDGVDSAGVSISMSAVAPKIDEFYYSHVGITAEDTTFLRWTSSLADSLVIVSGIGKVMDPDSGSIEMTPSASRVDTAIAYNSFGADTMVAAVSVVVPTQIILPQGKYHRGAMGGAGFDPVFLITVADSGGVPVARQWVHFRSLTGDGQLMEDSIRTDSTGIASPTYEFNGALGYATILAEASGLTSDTAKLRANRLLPGADWQGQYILSSDFYWDVLQLNGEPASIDPFPGYWLVFANYEDSLGVVVMIDDINHDRTANSFESVLMVIVNSVYQGKTPDSIGIGSSYADLTAAYGAPDTLFFDTTSPAAWQIEYDSLGLTLFGNETDTTIIEIHISAPFAKSSGAKYQPRRPSASATRAFLHHSRLNLNASR